MNRPTEQQEAFIPAVGGRPSRAREGLLGRFIAEWVRPRWRMLAVALGLTALLAAVGSVYPLVIKHSFDAFTKGGEVPLHWIMVAIVAVTTSRAVLLYAHAVITNRIVLRMTTDIQRRAIQHLLRADYARLTREAPGQLVSRVVHDIALIQTATQSAIVNAVRDALTIVALAAIMIYLDWMMSLIVIAIYPLAIMPVMALGKRLRRVAKQTQEHVGDLNSMLTENFGAARLIKTLRLEDHAGRRLGESFERYFNLRMRAVRNRSRVEPMLEAVAGIAIAGVIAFAAWRVGSTGSTIGDFMGFTTAMVMAAQSVRGLGGIAARVQEGLAAAERLYALLDEQPRIVDRPGAPALVVGKAEIRFEGVSFSYEGDSARRAVSDIDLIVPGGATVALVGASGSGKTTLVNLVPRLFDVEKGRILIDGQDIRDVTVTSLRGAIAMVSQDVVLFDDTIRANIALGRIGATEAEIEAAARAAAAHDFIVAQPQGYDTMIGDRGLRLSGGQRQRLALARAILADSPILLLDEATSALDSHSEQQVQEALRQFTRNRTTLVVAHRLSTIQDADLVCVMEAGRIVERGSHSELIAAGGTYHRLSRAQHLTDMDAR